MPTPDFTAFPIPTLLLDQGGATTTGSTTIRILADRFRDYGVNVKDFGATGNGSTDDTAAIQAAIDYAYGQNIQTVYLPAGQYKTTSPLFLDPPNNLRLGYPPVNSSPPIFNFSLALEGERGLPNEENDGTSIRPTFNDKCALFIGPGQGMRVANLTIIGPGNAYRGALSSAGAGVGLTGTGGGSSRTLIEHVGVVNFATAFLTAANGNGTLQDSNTFIKCHTDNVKYAYFLAGSQNYINSFYDCNCGGSEFGIYVQQGVGARVFGGNWSNNAGLADTFALSAISAITATPIGNHSTYTFTATLAGTFPSPRLLIDVYNSHAIKTVHFGIIPIEVLSFDAGTHVASMRILDSWSAQYYTGNALTYSDLQAEIQAATTLYSAERVTTFSGNGIQVHGVHIENAFSPMTLIHTFEAFGSGNNNVLDAIQFNYDPSCGDLKGSADPSAGLAKWYVQQSWPFVQMDTTSGQLTIQNSQLGQGQAGEPVIYEIQHGVRFVMRECNHANPMNMRVPYNGGFTSFDNQINQPALGGGEFDATPFASYASRSMQGGGDSWHFGGSRGQHPMWGFRPAEYSHPSLDPSHVTTALVSLGAIAYSAGVWAVPYPLLWGTHIYKTMAWDQTAANNYQVFSNHQFYTYGQDLTITNVPSLAWSYKGGSHAVYANVRTLELMFPGLGVKLFDGSTDVLYIVTGVYISLGYFTVVNASSVFGGNLSGASATVFTGTTIKQQPFAIQVVSGPKTAVTKTGDFTVGYLENNIIVNKGSTCTVTLPSALLYSGRSITIKTIQAFTVVSASANVIPLAGGAAAAAILAATAGKWAKLTSNGTNWEIVQSN